jgi:hypothetical protein
LSSASIVDNWRLSIEEAEVDLWVRVSRYLEAGDTFDVDGAAILNIPAHLYEPVIYANRATVKASPVALNAGERLFLIDLSAFCRANKAWMDGRNLFVLRNLSRGRGIGFFEGNNFYPDFMLWIVEPDGRQYLTFVDPKGLTHLGKDDPKISFHRAIRDIEARLGSDNLVLNSFILSNTRLQDIRWREEGWTARTFADECHVLFPSDTGYVAELLARIVGTSPVPRKSHDGVVSETRLH